KAVAQTRAYVGDQVVGVVVKEGLSTFSALHLHPARAQELIRQGAEEAVRKAGAAKPLVLPQGCSVEVEFEHQSRADQAAYLPKVRRGGERFVVFEPANGLEFIRTFRAITKAAAIRMSP
ncbi:MAG TPA: M55 family metallopeptidase, partial [Thermomicrobiales bacterium]